MKKLFTYLSVTFEYELIREKRTHMMIQVKPDRSVVVTAPLDTKDEKIDAFLQRKLRWILKHRRHFEKFKPEIPKEYISGEIFRYLGQEYQLLVQGATDKECVFLQGDKLVVSSWRPQSSLYTRKLLDAWYGQEGARVFAEQLQLCAMRFKLPHVPKLAIRSMTSRHGSYSPRTKRVCLNLKLIKLDLALIDYIIIHELCHITCHGHNQDFYDLLESYLPDWKRLERNLRDSALSG
ncbi:MAG: SprT family zinc-dependent metalloprotease [Kiritimatiellae bacterium]|nr:SprT family zinc-dependent metalloprotease [Kiritimatiellia bacterium]